ncbi:MAG: VacJ family lipoprotein [Pseudomonadota bacterium]|jgi:phospholipid-binding lipoprotein MlaA|nr:VacJ family lipoprotein [Pseudomonadota bacterium]
MIFGNLKTDGRRAFGKIAALAFGALVVTGCESLNDASNDPFEDVNRVVFDFNNKLDNAVFEPIAKGYEANIHKDIRYVVSSALKHIKTPVILANNILQADPAGIENTVTRFVSNTVLGVGGLDDWASRNGRPYREEDFGQTLAVWGVGEGPYLVLPIIGPMSTRDGAGRLVDSFADPLNEIDSLAFEWSHRGIGALDTRAGLIKILDDLERTSLDYYAAVRSLYRQKRKDKIANGKNGGPVPVPNIKF